MECVNGQECIRCDSAKDYFVENRVCAFCGEEENEVLAGTSLEECRQCVLEGCSDCRSLEECGQCNETEGFYLANGTCHFCNQTLDHFIQQG